MPFDPKEYNKQYKIKNKEKHQQQNKEYYQKNKKLIEEKKKKYREHMRDYFRNYFREYAKKNKETIKQYQVNRRKNNISHRLNHNLSCSISHSLKLNHLSKNKSHWEDIVGYTIKNLKEHIENLFQLGMTWENYGEWHIDHIIPKSFFKYKSTNDTEFKYCWSLLNLQPLWKEENLSKSNKII